MKTRLLTLTLITILSFAVAGCGNSGGGGSSSSSSGTATALQVPDRVSVVDSQNSGSSAASLQPLKMSFSKAASALPSSSDYNTDETFVYVEERSAESFNIINEILCMMGQTKYDEMMNKGNYKAQIDMGQCENSKDSASSAGESSQNQSSGSNATEYEFWTVNSSRADASSPHIVKVWIHEKADSFEPAKIIDVKTIITESVSATNPYGLFEMYFKGHPPNDSTVLFSGYLKSEKDSSGTVLLKFFDSGNFDIPGQGTMTFTEKVTLNRGSDGSSGSGTMSMEDSDPFSGSSSKSFDIAYSNTYFYRSDGTTNVCLSRENPDVTAWRYGLYYDENHATPGARVSINSGFPIKYSSNGTEYHGWVGYYGLWFPDSVSLSSGDTVYRQTYSASGTTETPYTVFISRGKLRRHVKKSVTLAEIANVPISWNECTDQGGGNWSCTDTRVTWNSTTQKFMKNAVRSQSTNWVWQDITEAEVTFDSNAWDFNFYSESLGGSGRINLMDPSTGQQTTLTNSTAVVFHLEDAVFPGDSDVPSTLACFENCPNPSAINTTSPYFANSSWQSSNNIHYQQNVAPSSATYYSYGFNSNTLELEYNSTPAVLTDSTNSQHGIWTGAMFEPTSTNLAKLACDWDTGSTCSWQAWDKLDVFYTWETGTQQWNRLTALQKDGSFVSFDPPISVEYTHTWPDSSTSKFYLEYNGFGDLHGIPGKCVDMDSGQDVECWDSTGEKFIRWVPEFSISDGSTVTNAIDGATYYVKALEKEERMSSVATSQCTTAGLSLQTYTLPDASLYQDPNIGDEPTVADAPAVIGGVLQ